MISAILAAQALAAASGGETSVCGGNCTVEKMMRPVAVDASPALALNAPPCGTPMAERWPACIRWEVRDCPAPPPSFFPPDTTPRVPPTIPIGCEDTWRGWRAPPPPRGGSR